MNSLKKLLTALIQSAEMLGLPEQDLNYSNDFLQNHEYRLSLDQITTQLYEHDIEVTDDFYLLVSRIAHKMELAELDYTFVKDLIRNKEVKLN